MTKTKLAVLIVGISMVAACSKPTVVAQAPPDQTPVAPAQAPKPAVQQPKQIAAAAPKETAPAPPAAAPKKLAPDQRRALNELLAELEDALFDYDKAEIRTDAVSALGSNIEVIRGIMSDYPAEKILIEGHADERGSAEYNLALGDRRARAVQTFLTGRGIPTTQLTVISFGEERPICSNENETCWQQNRRAHLTVAP